MSGMTNENETAGNSDAALADDWAAALDEQADEPTQATPPAATQVNQPAARTGERNLDLVLDIPVTISMEIGRVKVPIRNLLQLTQGSVVELDRLAGEPLDVLVNGTLIAHGEVVVVNERYGIRFTDVVSPAERVQGLR